MLKISFKKIPVDTSDFPNILRGWHTLNKVLYDAPSVSWCIALAKYETRRKNRPFIIERIISKIISLGTDKIREWANDLDIKTNKKSNTRK